MKKTLIALAALASLSGVALAERPTESSDRVDYVLKSDSSVQSSTQVEGLVSGDAVSFDDERRLDEKNDNFN